MITNPFALISRHLKKGCMGCMENTGIMVGMGCMENTGIMVGIRMYEKYGKYEKYGICLSLYRFRHTTRSSSTPRTMTAQRKMS